MLRTSKVPRFSSSVAHPLWGVLKATAFPVHSGCCGWTNGNFQNVGGAFGKWVQISLAKITQDCPGGSTAGETEAEGRYLGQLPGKKGGIMGLELRERKNIISQLGTSLTSIFPGFFCVAQVMLERMGV